MREVEREVEVEKSNIRAMKVVCSLHIKMVNTKETYSLILYVPWCYPRDAANDERSPAICINSLTVLRSVFIVRFNLHCGQSVALVVMFPIF